MFILKIMEITTIDVPRGVQYLSDWEAFSLPITPTIINKQITGCGFTEWCIRNDLNLVVCSPRKILLENKEQQHPGEVLYVRNELEVSGVVDEDISKPKTNTAKVKTLNEKQIEQAKKTISRMKKDVQDYYYNTTGSGRPCKILVTYDSFRHVKDALGSKIKDFYIVVDEFQSIFMDSRFKSSTELEFVEYLQDLQKVSFVSATPMMEKYLNELDKFKYLPYIRLDWGSLEPGRVIKPEIEAKPCESIVSVAKEYIQSYLSGNFQKFNYYDSTGNIQSIESKELVIYVNSVKNICDIITKCGLTMDNTNVLCANYPENQKKVKKAFGLTSRKVSAIGSVPGKGEPHKMFTLCTRTVYLGADFYSLCARSLILSDANIECLAVDITLDLPQILGRQRLKENPWKNRAELYYKTKTVTKNSEDFEELIERVKAKKSMTEDLLGVYANSNQKQKDSLAIVYQDRAKSRSYKDDYVAVNTHGGSSLYPVLNDLVMVSEIRAYEIQQIDYKDRFSVVNSIQRENMVVSNERVYEFLDKFHNTYTFFTDKMKLLCEYAFSGEDLNTALISIPMIYGNYYTILGPEKIKSLSYQKSKLENEYLRLVGNQENKSSLLDLLFDTFKVSNKYTLSMVKDSLKDIYAKSGIDCHSKASDLEKYFEVKLVYMTNKETKKREKGYLIIKIKE